MESSRKKTLKYLLPGEILICGRAMYFCSCVVLYG